MSRLEIRREALTRQGTTIVRGGRRFRILGDQSQANFESGAEGLVHRAIEETANIDCRIKCFWEPTRHRRLRSELLIQRQFPCPTKRAADALGGAPMELLDALGPETPFAIVMKNINGQSWLQLREQAQAHQSYPPPDWPPIQVRATWAYGLATAIKTLEAGDFVHADLSPGNVMVTGEGETAGDMALIDFDGFVDLRNRELKAAVNGSEGYAAPEIWQDRAGTIGSDRIGMAILIQEFLMIGDPRIQRREAFGWRYDQKTELAARTAEPHPLLASTFPQIAELVVETLRTADSGRRPSPELWRQLLMEIVDGKPAAPLRDVVLEPYPLKEVAAAVSFADSDSRLDLSTTAFGIRSVLERLPNGAVRIVVSPQATLRVRTSENPHWRTYIGGSVVPLTSGLILYDSEGKIIARVVATT